VQRRLMRIDCPDQRSHHEDLAAEIGNRALARPKAYEPGGVTNTSLFGINENSTDHLQTVTA